jgi:hypothetical protein
VVESPVVTRPQDFLLEPFYVKITRQQVVWVISHRPIFMNFTLILNMNEGALGKDYHGEVEKLG